MDQDQWYLFGPVTRSYRDWNLNSFSYAQHGHFQSLQVFQAYPFAQMLWVRMCSYLRMNAVQYSFWSGKNTMFTLSFPNKFAELNQIFVHLLFLKTDLNNSLIFWEPVSFMPAYDSRVAVVFTFYCKICWFSQKRVGFMILTSSMVGLMGLFIVFGNR